MFLIGAAKNVGAERLAQAVEGLLDCLRSLSGTNILPDAAEFLNGKSDRHGIFENHSVHAHGQRTLSWRMFGAFDAGVPYGRHLLIHPTHVSCFQAILHEAIAARRLRPP